MQALITVLIAGYLTSQALDSLLRWAFDLFGMGAAIYARDYALLIVVLLCVYLILKERRDISRLLFLAAFLVWGVAFAIWAQLGIPQILFGIKVWLPLIAGFVLVESRTIGALDRPRFWGALWAITCLGIFANYFVRMPWAGLVVQVGDLAISGNREWTAGTVNRLSGFSRTSYDAAIIILLLYLYLSAVWQGIGAKALLIVVSGAAIALTTTKGAAGAFLICLPLAYVLEQIKQPRGSLRWPCLAMLFGAAAIGCVVPLISTQLTFPRWEESSVEFWLFASFVMRAWDTWPVAFSLLSDFQRVSGRGIGGIGSAQYTFEREGANPADSFFVYLYVTAGVVGALAYLYLAFASVRLRLNEPLHRAAFLFLMVTFAYGLTVNLVESAAFAMALGCVAAALSASGRLESNVA